MRKKGLPRLLLTIFAALAGLCLALTAILAVITASRPALNTTADRLNSFDKARLAEALHLRQARGEEVLPGWAQADIPVIVFNDAYLFLVGCPDPADGWVLFPQGTRMGAAWEVVPGDDFYGQPYYRQKLPAPGVNSTAFTVQVGDRWAASLGTYEWMQNSLVDGLRQQLPAPLRAVVPLHLATDLFIPGSDGYVTLVLHEAVHAYQGIRAPGRLADAEARYGQVRKQYPWEDAAFRAGWQGELDTLDQALRAESPAETRRLAQDFLARRAARRKAANLSAELIEMERLKEWEEGIGKYGERSIYLLAAGQEAYQPIPEIAADPDFHRYQQAQQKWDQEIEQMRRMAADDSDGRFYYTGFAQAVLLDRLSPGWKERLFAGDAWLEDLLAQAVTAGQGQPGVSQ